MYHRAILDVDSVAYANGIDIAAHDCAPPYGAIITHDDIADDNSIVGQEAVFTKNRVNVVKRTNDSQMQVKSEK